MGNENQRFEYTYSAKQQEEIEQIRQKYLPKPKDEMEQLRRLDEKVTRKVTMYSIIMGLSGCLLFGAGLTVILKEISKLFGFGMVAGIFGLVVMGITVPFHNKILEKERKKHAQEILELSERLLHK